ncbi:MAG: hypothetical protein KIT17_02350 [Rubrivivax sp.]|nr:hypothetical protein [Rubrivivax sp.]
MRAAAQRAARAASARQAPVRGRAGLSARLRTDGVRAAVGLAALTCLPAAGACPLTTPAPPGEQRIEAGALQLAWRAEPAPLAVGRPFALELHVCPRAARLLRVDATMPEHRHGMNYRPSLRPLGEGRWRAEGLLWHMAGRWELAVEVDAHGERRWLRQSVSLP